MCVSPPSNSYLYKSPFCSIRHQSGQFHNLIFSRGKNKIFLFFPPLSLSLLTKCGSSRTGNIILVVTVTSGLLLMSSGGFGFGPTEWPEGGFATSSRFRSLFVAWSRPPSTRHYRVGIKIRKAKLHLNMEALCIGCRNNHWSQYFNQILI